MEGKRGHARIHPDNPVTGRMVPAREVGHPSRPLIGAIRDGAHAQLGSRNARLRVKAQVDRLEQLTALGTEELRIKDERMKRILPHKRPHYSPVERMSILELRAARAWLSLLFFRKLIEP